MNKILDNNIEYIKYGLVYSLGVVMIGYALLVLGVYQMLVGSWFSGIVFLVLGAYLAFTREGIAFNLNTNEFSFYVKYVGFEKHNWISLEGFPYITVLKRSMSQRRGLKGGQTVTKFIDYDLFLLNETHLQKVKVQTFLDGEAAMEKANSLANLFNIELVDYSPQISERTRARRR